MAAHYERLQDRGDHDDPALPAELVRGAPDSLLAPVAVEPARLVESAIEAGREQVERLVERVDERLVEEARERAPEFFARDAEPTLPRLEWMRDWRPERKS